MKLITNRDQLIRNIKTLDKYVAYGSQEEKLWAKERIRLGICFVAYTIDKELRFAPSRFIGYQDNSREKHEKNTAKDGRDTNPAITAVLGTKYGEQVNLNSAYVAYCKKLGITLSQITRSQTFNMCRKFWDLVLEPAY
ncbi:MAG: hypothetical protein LBP88_00205 [Treponema sp.]|nr:hypothetical protein [Treponema sp.]